MNQTAKSPFDLEERTLKFAKDVRVFITALPKTVSNLEDMQQLVRSSGSIGANYIEANESLSKKDFVVRTKICRKESKESIYWINLLNVGGNPELESERQRLSKEARELMNIFAAIMRKAG